MFDSGWRHVDPGKTVRKACYSGILSPSPATFCLPSSFLRDSCSKRSTVQKLYIESLILPPSITLAAMAHLLRLPCEALALIGLVLLLMQNILVTTLAPYLSLLASDFMASSSGGIASSSAQHISQGQVQRLRSMNRFIYQQDGTNAVYPDSDETIYCTPNGVAFRIQCLRHYQISAIKTTSASGIQECIDQCSLDPTCKSVSYRLAGDGACAFLPAA